MDEKLYINIDMIIHIGKPEYDVDFLSKVSKGA